MSSPITLAPNPVFPVKHTTFFPFMGHSLKIGSTIFLKWQQPSTKLHWITSRKTVISLLVVVRTSALIISEIRYGIRTLKIFFLTVLVETGYNQSRHVGVLLAANSQSTSKSGYPASLWDPWPDFILLFFFSSDNYFSLLSMRPLWRENGSAVYSAITH
jgi:hypothetical protein